MATVRKRNGRGESIATTIHAEVENIESAKAAGLRYVSQWDRGIRRLRKGKGFVYVGARVSRCAIPIRSCGSARW